ncbi:hypothetical protein Fcan01_22260 [Folsomia candida]|uniref:Uncharacterized protein n=1 Tax=Folsomia candida TaxID=158441 RepID=A0A226DFJ8_FOLCA|nr:hypothetical protein Fcan01_22260 [Folsomia candida]
MEDQTTQNGLEPRLEKQEKALEALKDVPDILKKLMDGRNFENPDPDKGKWSLGLSEDEDDDVNKLIGTDISKDDESEKEIEILLDDVEKGTEPGPEIALNVAQSFLKTVARPLSKESRSKLRDSIKTPSNCKEFATPKVNNEIWKIIPSHARLNDVKQQQTQQALGTGISAMAMITNLILSKKSEIPKEIVSSVVRIAMDAGNILGDQTQQINIARRMDMKKYLNPEYGGICSSEVPQSEWLFGNDLNESLKSSKATSSLMRNTAVQGNRFHPYKLNNSRTNFNSQRSLNFSRPFRHHRGSGQFRPYNNRPNYSGQNQLLWKSQQSQRGGK